MPAIASAIAGIAQKNLRILEIGVGDGRFVKQLLAWGIEASFFGVDLVPRQASGIFIPVVGDARRLPFKDATFDVVCSLGVVEHFLETEMAIQEHARVVRRGGIVVVTTPHLGPDLPLSIVSHIVRNGHDDVSFMTAVGRFLSLRRVTQWFQQAGLTVLTQTAFHDVIPTLTAHVPSASKVFNQPRIRRRYGRHLCVIGSKP